MIISVLPLFLLLIDGYHQKKIDKSIFLIAGFVVFGLIMAFAIRRLSLNFAISIPFLLAAFILLGTMLPKSHNKTNKDNEFK